LVTAILRSDEQIKRVDAHLLLMLLITIKRARIVDSRRMRRGEQSSGSVRSYWGASRIHGELLMLGVEVAQSTVSKYMLRGRRPPSQSGKTFLRNHASAIAAIDLCVVTMVTFERLFAFLVIGHGRRQLLWLEVTRHPTAEWLAAGREFPSPSPDW
jgi:hypothetical protein